MIWVESHIEKYAHSRVEIMVKARSQFKRRSTANNVEIIVPVPSDADTPKFRTTTGTCKWVSDLDLLACSTQTHIFIQLPEKSAVSWQVKSFPGGKEFLMRASFGLPTVESEEVEGRPPIQVYMEIVVRD